MAGVNLDYEAIEDMLNGFDGPVAAVIMELSEKATDISKINASLQKKKNWSWSFAKSTSSMPRSVGYLKAGIHSHGPAYNRHGQLYGGVNAPYAPTEFLKEQHKWHNSGPHELNRFFSIAIDSLEI